MLILLDHSAPRALRSHLPGHTVHTAAQMGWDRRPDDQLISLAQETGYHLLITADQNIRRATSVISKTWQPSEWR